MDHKTAWTMFENSFRETKRFLWDGALIDNIANSPNFHKMKYTCLHRQAIFTLADRLGINQRIFWIHDIDKYFMYLSLDESMARECHRRLNLHHYYNIPECVDRIVLIEMMLDWESARLSKPDKPLNAYETLHKLMPNSMIQYMEPLLKEYGLNHPCTDHCITTEEYELMAKSVTPEIIARDIRIMDVADHYRILAFNREHSYG